MKFPFCTDCDSWITPLPENDLVGDSVEGYGRSADYFFGPGSQLVAGTDVSPRWIDRFPWIDSYAYEALVVGIFVLACYLVYRHWSSISWLFKLQMHRVPLEKAYEEQTLFFRNFLRISLVMMVLLVGGIVIRLSDFWHLSDQVPGLSRWGVNGVVPVVLGAIGGVILYRYLANRLIGIIIQNTLFFDRYRFMKRVFSAVGTVLITPIFLICALYEGTGAPGLIYLMASLIVLLLGAYIGASYRFFIGRNVSILQWILYLCTVEIFPLSFLLFVGLRHTM